MSAKAKVLVCDDDPLLLELLGYRLNARGYDVVTAADGRAALSQVSAERPALVVLDAMMPHTDGFEVLSRIKADPELSETLVVMLTARKSERDIVSALEKGADDYISKPFIPDELLARVAKLVRGRRPMTGT